MMFNFDALQKAYQKWCFFSEQNAGGEKQTNIKAVAKHYWQLVRQATAHWTYTCMQWIFLWSVTPAPGSYSHPELQTASR